MSDDKNTIEEYFNATKATDDKPLHPESQRYMGVPPIKKKFRDHITPNRVSGFLGLLLIMLGGYMVYDKDLLPSFSTSDYQLDEFSSELLKEYYQPPQQPEVRYVYRDRAETLATVKALRVELAQLKAMNKLRSKIIEKVYAKDLKPGEVRKAIFFNTCKDGKIDGLPEDFYREYLR